MYVGYAIVVFRDAEECRAVQGALDGRLITPASVFAKDDFDNPDFAAFAMSDAPPFRIKVRPAVEASRTKQGDAPKPNGKEDVVPNIVPAGRDPPLADQLRPLETDALIARTRRLVDGAAAAASPASADEESAALLSRAGRHAQALARAVAAVHQGHRRPEVRHEGRALPATMAGRLLALLQNLRWAVPNHRPGLTAERYLVLLTRAAPDVFYQDLREACRDLVAWADPSYYYSGVAVTKNFVSSPHVDDRDRSFQYAVALGDFTAGGELCVAGLDREGREVLHVVDTHNRIAAVDGRRVHWVRTWEGGDRYSLIFFDTSDRRPTPLMAMGVDATIFVVDEEAASIDVDAQLGTHQTALV